MEFLTDSLGDMISKPTENQREEIDAIEQSLTQAKQTKKIR